MFNTYERQLPAAVIKERETMLGDAVAKLRAEGYGTFQVDDLEGFDDPEDIFAPRTNVPIRPDIVAQNGDQPVYAVAEVSSVLSDDLWGRRWQSLDQWCKANGGRFIVYVHPEDHERGKSLARQWKVDEAQVMPLERGKR